MVTTSKPAAGDFNITKDGEPMIALGTQWASSTEFAVIMDEDYEPATYLLTYTKGAQPFKVLATGEEYDSFGPISG